MLELSDEELLLEKLFVRFQKLQPPMLLLVDS